MTQGICKRAQRGSWTLTGSTASAFNRVECCCILSQWSLWWSIGGQKSLCGFGGTMRTRRDQTVPPLPWQQGHTCPKLRHQTLPRTFHHQGAGASVAQGQREIMHSGASDNKCSVVVVPAAVAQWGQPQRLKENAVVENGHDFHGRRREPPKYT